MPTSTASQIILDDNRTKRIGKSHLPWWNGAIIYEIYIRSFQDSNNDGIGDLNGVTSRLDYLHELGIDAVWLSPMYPSPQVDFGYDIAEFCAIDPQFGTIEDFDTLIKEAKKRNIKVLLDLVLNHTSDQHPWFIESKSSKDNAKRDWYVWKEGKKEENSNKNDANYSNDIPPPPNNWMSLFGHSAWEWDNNTKQYYYHYFYKQQPDLNWRNPQVQQAMFDVMKFWLHRGVGGFRLDAVANIYESEDLPDAPLIDNNLNEFGDPNTDHKHQNFQPELHDVIRSLRSVVSHYPDDPVLVGEVYLTLMEDLAAFYGAKNDGLHLPMNTSVGFIDKWDVTEFRARLSNAQTGLRGNIPLFVTDNHDKPRAIDRYGNGKSYEERVKIGRILATILLTQRASVLLYYGQEIGMETTELTRVEDVQDPIGITGWPREKGRDGERTPMQWDASVNAGFTNDAVKPWLPLPKIAKSVNVEQQLKEETSILNYYRHLLALRKSHSTLKYGQCLMLNHDHDKLLVWLRILDPANDHIPSSPPVLIVCNFASESKTISLFESLEAVEKISSNVKSLLKKGEKNDLKNITLEPYGILVGELDSL